MGWLEYEARTGVDWRDKNRQAMAATSVLVSKELLTDQIVREACRAYVAPSSCSAWAMASRRATN